MSRTKRKSYIVATETKEQYVNRRMARLYTHYEVESYMTPRGKELYKKAVEEYEIAFQIWVNLTRDVRLNYHRRPKEPHEYEFRDRRYIKVEYDYEAEAKKFAKEYEKLKRDGKLYETSRNKAFKKHCAKDLRNKNKEVINKILKGDDSWEKEPFPDTYLGKKYIWDYW